MTINLFIALLLIFIGHKAREIEISNLNLQTTINKLNEEIEINKIEYTFHTNSEYLKKLYSLYNPNLENEKTNKVLSFNDFSDKKNNNILLVDY